MNARRRRHLGLVALLFASTTACATASASHPAAGPSTTAKTSMPPGMSMSPGMSMPGASDESSTSPGRGTGPSASARMVCGPEIRANIAKILAPQPVPSGTATWAHHLYTCTYALSGGPLVLSVKESSDVAAAHSYFATLRRQLRPTRPLRGLEGLGLPAYESRDGTVVFLKDDKTLQVDATRVSVGTGSQSAARAGLAYEVGTDVMGCWSGD